MDRIQPPPNYFGAPYPQQDMSHTNFAPPPNMSSYSPRQEMNNNSKPKENNFEPLEQNDYLTKFMEGHIGQKVKVYCSFTDSAQWHDMVFEGLVWGAGDDNLIIYDQKKNIHTLIMAVYILYIEFEDIENKNSK
jgi:hypothetical protein